MPTRVGVGFSILADPQEAAYQAARIARSQLDTPRADLSLVFTAGVTEPETIVDVVQTVLEPLRLIGTSVNGLISPEGYLPRGVGILAINSSEISCGIAPGSFAAGADSHSQGFDLAKRMCADLKSSHRQAGILFADPALVDHASFLRGAQEVLGIGFPLTGALSAPDASGKSRQFVQKETLNKNAAGLVLGGANIAFAHTHGFKPLGKPRTITRMSGRVLNTIDDKPAFSLYEHFLGAEAAQMAKDRGGRLAALYPLGIYIEDQRQYLIKNAVDILPDGSIVCQGDLPENGEVHLMIATRDSSLRSAAAAAARVKEALGSKPAKLIFIIESASRRQFLRNMAAMGTNTVRDALGASSPMIGICTSGVIGPLGIDSLAGGAFVQNDSILVIGLE